MKLVNFILFIWLSFFCSYSVFSKEVGSFISIEECGASSVPEQKYYCIYDVTGKAKKVVMPLGLGDIYANRHSKLIHSKKGNEKYVLITISYESNSGNSPSTKVIILGIGFDKLIPKLITESWRDPVVLDIDKDDEFKLVIYSNPFDIKDGGYEKWPIVLDGRSFIQMPVTKSMKAFFMESLRKMESQILEDENYCKMIVEKRLDSECRKRMDLDKLKKQKIAFEKYMEIW